MVQLKSKNAIVSITVAALLLLLLTLPAHVAAWEGLAHDMITMEALGALPARLKDALEPFRGQLLSGVGEPDRNRVETHKIHLHRIGRSRPAPGGPYFGLERFAEKAEEMLKAEKPLSEIAFVMGQAAHFIQHLNVPLHTITGETDLQHRFYESRVYFRNWPGDRCGYAGLHLVKSYQVPRLRDSNAQQSVHE